MSGDQNSTLSKFNDIRRCIEVFADGIEEEELLKALQLQEKFRLECIATTQMIERIQGELNASLQSISDLESKLLRARRLLEAESQKRKKIEKERDTLEHKIMAAAKLLHHDHSLPNEMRDKLTFLHILPYEERSMSHASENNLDGGDNKHNTTRSLLSDLSVTSSEDNTSVDNLRHNQKPINDPTNVINQQKKRLSRHDVIMKASNGVTVTRKYSNQCLNLTKGKENDAESICTITKVTLPQDTNESIMVESTMEMVPAITQKGDNKIAFQKKAYIKKHKNDRPITSRSQQKDVHGKQVTPLNSSVVNQQQQEKLQYGRKQKPQQQITQTHNFTNKTFFRAEACVVCAKKIRFGLRCRNCDTPCHVECRSNVGMACPLQINGTLQSGKDVSIGFIYDHTPTFPPKIPPIIVHCVNEIEARSMKTVGLYRVSGSKRKIKSLMESFLLDQNNLQDLSSIDIHVLCGCVKDFLLRLREPLIPTAMWKDFHNAVQNPTEKVIRKYLLPVVENLPQANKDTLAFLILHLQRIANCPEISMNLDNIARVFGPSIVGNSTSNPDLHTVSKEVNIQHKVMLNLLKVPTSYWLHFIPSNKEKHYATRQNNKYNGESERLIQRTPSSETYILCASPSKSTLKERECLKK